MRITNIRILTPISKKNVTLIGFMYIRDKRSRIKRENIKVEVNEKDYEIKFPFVRIKKFRILDLLSNLYIVKIPIKDLILANIHNKIYFVYKTKKVKQKFGLRYLIYTKKAKYLNKRAKMIKELGTSIYVRQSINNRMFITVRQINRTDKLIEQVKINIACLLSKILPQNKIMMYEKESRKFEESASIVYKNLIDLGYENIYYIVDKNCSQIENVEEKYRKKFVYKYTFKHYLYFFSARALIGTESPGHAIELRVSNKHAVRRVYSNKFQYVFLQHGVMYMVSLDSQGRSFFRRDGGMPKDSKIVVSSQEEANHFIDLGGFKQEELYITGLPKFDKNIWNKNADKIAIMPTWRPWEFNISRNDIKNSRYCKMIKEIINGIPKELKDKIVLMPHPLMLEGLKDSSLSKYIKKDFIYDEVLKETKVLITDYSSIAYDAFYRGSNVIFYWKEKDYCMKQYKGHLMLNEENAFGIVCYNKQDLKRVIKNQYKNSQSKKNKAKYKKLVEFHDNNNTQRLIDFLKRDKIIQDN